MTYSTIFVFYTIKVFFSECALPFKKQHLKRYKHSFSHINHDHSYVTIIHRDVIIKFSKCSFHINPERILVIDQRHFKFIYFIHGSGTLHDNDIGWRERHVPIPPHYDWLLMKKDSSDFPLLSY